MKKLLTLISLTIAYNTSSAQPARRQISIKTIGKDSAVIHFNEDYYLIEDSCASIIRYCRFNFQHNLISGHFTDVSAAKPNLIVAEGNYNDEGLKNGAFTLRYLNGNHKANGSYENNFYTGKWETFYENGNPELQFEVTDGELHINSYWNTKGKQTVINGKGDYRYDFGSTFGKLYWKGKLENGRPAGKWKLYQADDVSEQSIGDESFKNGKFTSGSVRDFNYSNTSHIQLVDPDKLEFLHAEKLLFSIVPCNGVKPKHIVGAQYINGLSNFLSEIADAVTPVISRINLRGINNSINFDGEVSEKGALINLKQDNVFREDIARQIIYRIQNLNLLHPATADGVPVKQKFQLSFIIADGSYYTEIKLLPIRN